MAYGSFQSGYRNGYKFQGKACLLNSLTFVLCIFAHSSQPPFMLSTLMSLGFLARTLALELKGLFLLRLHVTYLSTLLDRLLLGGIMLLQGRGRGRAEGGEECPTYICLTGCRVTADDVFVFFAHQRCSTYRLSFLHRPLFS